MANQIKNFLSKMSAAQIILSLIIIFSFIIFLAIQAATKVAAGKNPLALLVFLTFMLLLTRLSILAKVGIGFIAFILFPVQMIFGPLAAIIMIIVTTLIYMQIATRPTPIDFAITKGVQSAFAQTIYVSLWVISMIPLFSILEVGYIMANLNFVYMLSVVVYVIFMVICLPLFAREPIPMAIINGLIMLPFQFFLIKYFGQGFIQYLLSFA